MQLIPITKAYRRGYDRVAWDVDDMGVVRAGRLSREEKIDAVLKMVRADVFPPDKIPGMPAARYQGC